MTNNFDLYKEYITNDFNNSLLDDGDMYFVVELMRRGKDNPDMPAANYHFKNYYIRKPEDLDRYKSEIIMLCDMLRLRAYVSVNYKSFRQVTLDTLAELARRVSNNDYKKNYNVYESCSGQYCHSQNKRWVIDIDDETSINSDKVKKIEDIINLCQPINKNKIITKIPTKSGVHIITTPFDRIQFALNCTDNLENGINDMPDIKKNHLTLLYENL
jgi:hypothetical protein